MIQVLSTYPFDVSVIVTSYNTRDLVRECLQSLAEECLRLPGGLHAEIILIDDCSKDGTIEMVEAEFSASEVPVRFFRNSVNLGFGGANNAGMEKALGKYILLLNSDAFLHPGSLYRAIQKMDASPDVGIGGAKLVSRDGGWQPSARQFPSLWNDAITMTGLAARFPKSRIFGAPDRTWADPDEAADVDWVPGAFFLLRREALAKTGLFDPIFFIYLEEVDLCRRIKQAGYRVSYWPDVVVTHIGGETAKQNKSQLFSGSGSQVVLWRLRSTFLYYRKTHGWKAWQIYAFETVFYNLRRLRNLVSFDLERRQKAGEWVRMLAVIRQAWSDTEGGRVCPPRPW